MAIECYRLHVDGRTEYVRASREALRAEMREYVAAEMARGRPLSNIEFTWTPVRYQVFASKAQRD